MNIYQKITRGLKKRFLFLFEISCFLLYFFIPSTVFANSQQFTTTTDWNAGTASQIDLTSQPDAVQLQAAGIWGAKAWKNPDQVISVGSAFATDGTDIYVARGVGDVLFWKYSTQTDTWTSLANMPYGVYYGSELEYLDGYVYAIFGAYQTAYARYSVANNTWELLADIPELAYTGASLSSDGTNLYALTGNNTQNFYKYTVSTNTWSALAGAPATIRQGSDLVKVGNYFYTPRGNNSTTFYRYDISAGTWATMSNLPGTMYDDVDITTDGTYIYVPRENNTANFYRYTVATDTWTSLTNLPANARYGAAIYVENDGYIYIFQGNNQYRLWKYNIATNSYLGYEETPTTFNNGSNLDYYNGYLYAARGNNSTSYYRLNISSNTWETLTSAPANFNDETDSVRVGTDIYYFRGSNTTDFYRYSTTGNSWTTLAVAPATVRFGAALAYPGSGDYIYATRGNSTSTFWRYSISGNSWDDVSVADIPANAVASYGSTLNSDGTNIFYNAGIGVNRYFKYTIGTDTWSELSTLPFTPFYGTDMTYYNGRMYALAGWYKTELWEYTISTDTWRKLPNFSGYLAQNLGAYTGASVESDGSGTLFVVRGNNYTDLLSFSVSENGFLSSGTWTSNTIDLTSVSSWGQFIVTDSKPSDSSVTYQTNTSSDGITWEGWQTVSGTTIASTEQRYLKVRANLFASTDNNLTPTVSDITVNYTGDATAPTNPSTVTGLSQQVGGASLTSGETYSYTQPYFSWSGASDSDTSISGYYVYFGTNASADPEVLGSFQTTTNYTITKPLSTGTYYLKIKTKDAVGNVSSALTAFEYVYGGISPAQSMTVSDTASFTGTADNTNISGDQIKLVNNAQGFWLEEPLSVTPATMQYGAKTIAYVSSTNKIYAFRGNNSTSFYEYDIDTDTWTTLANAPANVQTGGGVIEGPSGYLYGMRGANTTGFWRYDIASDTWSDEDATDTPLTISYGGSMVYDGSQYIYIMRGNSDDTFWRYDTSSDTWDSLATTYFGSPSNAVNDNVYVGGSLAIDRENELIFAIQGNYNDGFSMYNINTNAWTVLTDLPNLPYQGASIAYDSATNRVYYMPGNNSDLFYAYDVGNQTWSTKNTVPGPINYGGALRSVGSDIYAIRGGNTNGFYKYNVQKDSWLTPTRGLFGGLYQGTTYFTQNYGADIVKGDGDNFYILRGNYSDDFVKWNQTTGAITSLSRTPIGNYLGSSLVYDSTQNKLYLTGSVYNPEFFVYDIATNVWSKESNDPMPATTNYGSSMVYDGSRYIYLNRGGTATTFYRFDTQGSSGNKWSTMAAAPAGLGYGAELLLSGNYIYTLRGQNVSNNPFYRYDISGDSWTTLTDIGIDVYNDGFLADGGNGVFYAARGENDNDMFSYTVSSDSWATLEVAPANIYAGGSGESNGSNKLYMLPGSGTNAYQDGLYTYVMATDTSGFEESGSYISQSHDLTSVYKWANIDVVATVPDNTTLSVSTRSSADNSDWSSWVQVSLEKHVGTTYSYKINSPANRYIQVKFEFLSSDGVASAVIDDYTIYYYKDTTEPTNPETAGLSVYSDNTPGSPIVSGTWYGHGSPYFDWPDAEATYGASDTTTGSGVSGYYVYFGTNSEADPAVDGTLQSQSNYTGSSLIDGNTYYFRLKTVDDAGNISSSIWAPFTYKFDSVAAAAPSNLTADPSGYSATNSFDFSWDTVASASGAPVTDYCYKTGATSGAYSVDQCIQTNSISSIPSHKVGVNTFSVRTKDAAGNYSSYATTPYYYVDSANAPAPPLNLAVTPSSNTANSFAFSWDAPANGTFYGSASNLSYYYSINALPTAQSTTATSLRYLNAGAYATLPGENTFYVVSKDEAGNINYSNYASTTFTANTTAPGIPLNIDIADVSVKSTSSWKLAISWEAPATGTVATYAIYRSIDGTTFSQIASSGGISYVDVGLTQQTYYYKIKACDSTNNCGAFSDVVELFPDGKYVTPAELLSGPTVSDITTKKATVTWTTARTADSRLAYGTGSGEYFEEEVSNSLQVTSHTLNLTNLAPGTTYYITAKWTDEDGNIGSSEEVSFETAPPPTTEEAVVKTIGLDSALIEFISKNASTVRIYYGESSAFGGIENVVTGSGEGTHTVLLKDLVDGTKYYYKINSFDSEGEEYEGEIHSFTTLPRPKISNIKVNQVKGTAKSTLLLTWESNTEISSIVTYYPLTNPGSALDEVNIALKEGKHQMILYNLEPQTTYAVIIKGKDAVGNEAVGELQQIATSADTRPPEISELKVDTEIIGTGEEATAQLVVSYKTDEPSTAQIEFGEGSGSTYSQKTQEDSNLATYHLVVISELSPAKVYHLRAVSKDQYDNVAYSIDKAVITQKATENALDLVINSLSATFGFLQAR